MDIVLDASITLAWCFVDESTPFTKQLLKYLENHQAFVPSIWALEIANILLSAERRKRITYASTIEFLALINQLNIKIESQDQFRAFQEVFSLAHSQHLTTYDAAYLELAMRKGLPLASKDRQLCEVARSFGVEVLDSIDAIMAINLD